MHLIWPLHLATMAAFGAMILVGVSIRKKMPKADHPTDSLSKVLRWVPWPLILLCISAVAYTAINFAVFMGFTEGGSPAENDGRYYLQSHGKKIRDLEEGEYRWVRACEVRAFSGHWMLFSVIPMTFFFYVYPATGPGTKGDGQTDAGEAAEPPIDPSGDKTHD